MHDKLNWAYASSKSNPHFKESQFFGYIVVTITVIHWELPEAFQWLSICSFFVIFAACQLLLRGHLGTVGIITTFCVGCVPQKSN